MAIEGFSRADALKQASDSNRQGSTLRFAIFTVFLALNAALANVAFGGHVGSNFRSFQVAGVTAAAVFFVYQWRITRLLDHYQLMIRTLRTDLGLGDVELEGPEQWRWWVWVIGILMLLLHVGAMYFWWTASPN